MCYSNSYRRQAAPFIKEYEEIARKMKGKSVIQIRSPIILFKLLNGHETLCPTAGGVSKRSRGLSDLTSPWACSCPGWLWSRSGWLSGASGRFFAPCGFQKGWDHTCSRFVMEGSLGHTAKTLRRLAEVEAGKTCLLVSSHSFLGALATLDLVLGGLLSGQQAWLGWGCPDTC